MGRTSPLTPYPAIAQIGESIFSTQILVGLDFFALRSRRIPAVELLRQYQRPQFEPSPTRLVTELQSVNAAQVEQAVKKTFNVEDFITSLALLILCRPRQSPSFYTKIGIDPKLELMRTK
jgi:inhibitor of KinA sporulation pathway (predicted exonuclease)